MLRIYTYLWVSMKEFLENFASDLSMKVVQLMPLCYAFVMYFIVSVHSIVLFTDHHCSCRGCLPSGLTLFLPLSLLTKSF